MKNKLIALVPGDGAGPEMMKVACQIVAKAALEDDVCIEFEETPMGWSAYKEYGDTRPESSLNRAMEIGTIFFGGVGDPKFDETIGKVNPTMKPEARCLLKLRKEMGLLLNFRPMIYYPELAHLTKVLPEMIPEKGVQQHWIRFLLEDTYFGTEDMEVSLSLRAAQKIGLMMKSKVTGEEELVSDIGYYRRTTIEKYMRYALQYARDMELLFICIDKCNVSARYTLWRHVCKEIHDVEFSDVPIKYLYVDAANALLFTPAELHGVIACGNEHGDILSDGAAGALGSMGMMCSSAINPETRAAMFESGAGTASTLAGMDKANPLGRILTGALMLRHIGAPKGAESIENAVREVLSEGYRTGDLVKEGEENTTVLGTKEMGDLILFKL